MTKVLQLINGVPTTIEINSPYDESIYYSSGLAASTTITLPNSGSFTSSTAKDILIIVNKRVVEIDRDFNVIGGSPYTQIEFIYTLPNDTVVNFKQGI